MEIKNDHFRATLQTAHKRGFQTRIVAFDGWYSSPANLKAIRGYGWAWLARLKSNRHSNPDGTGNRTLAEAAISPAEMVVHLKAYGMIQVFRLDTPEGRLRSLALRCSIPLKLLAEQLRGSGGSRAAGFGPAQVRSMPDAIVKLLHEHYCLLS